MIPILLMLGLFFGVGTFWLGVFVFDVDGPVSALLYGYFLIAIGSFILALVTPSLWVGESWTAGGLIGAFVFGGFFLGLGVWRLIVSKLVDLWTSDDFYDYSGLLVLSPRFHYGVAIALSIGVAMFVLIPAILASLKVI